MSLEFLHLGSLFMIGMYFVIGIIQLSTTHDSGNSYFQFVETINFMVYTLSSVGFGNSVPIDVAGQIFTIFLMITGLLFFGLFIAKLQQTNDEVSHYSAYLQRQRELLETWMTRIETKSSTGSHQLFKRLKEHFHLLFKCDISEGFGKPYFLKVSPAWQDTISDEALKEMVDSFSSFFKSIGQAAWLDIFLRMKFRS